MVRTVDELDANVLDRVASQNARMQRFLDALVDSGDVFLGNNAADDLVLEQVALASFLRVHVDDRMAVLAATTGLTHELAFGAEHFVARTLAVSNLRLADVRFDLELTEQTVDDDLEVQLAHASDDGLAGLVVGGHAESRVLLSQLLQREAHLVLLSLGLRLDSNVDNGISELHGLKDDRSILGAQGVARGGVLQANNGNDVASGASIDVDSLVGVHLQQAADTLVLVLGSVDHVGTGIKLARVHTQVRELTNEGVGHNLEGQSREGSLRVGFAGVFLASLGVGALDGRNVARSRQVIDNGVEEFLNALVLVSGTHKDRVDLASDYTLAQSSLELFNGELFVHEDLLHEIVVAVGCGVHELLAVDGCIVGKLGRDGIHRLGVGHALVIGLEVPCGHGNEVDNAPEVVLSAHRQLSGNCIRAQTILHRLNRMQEVGADAVILVDERDARNAIALGLTPNGLRLRLNASDGVENSNGAVENTEGTLDLSSEVNVARGVDDLEAIGFAIFLPEAGGSSSGNSYAALLFLNHPVHGGSAIVDLADFVRLARVVQDTLGRGGFAGIDVSHDAKVTGEIKVVCLCHYLSRPTNDSARMHGWIQPSCRGLRAS